MANLKVSDQELQSILSELENDLGAFLNAEAEDRLAKAREEDGTPSPGMGSASASATSPAVSPSPSSSPGADPSAGAESPEGAPPASPEGEGAEMAPEGEEGAPPMGEEGGEPMGEEPGMEGQGAPMDVHALQAEYAKLPPEELKMHYLAAKAALFEVMGGAGAGASPAPSPAPSPSAPPPPSAGPAAGGAPMAMKEFSDLQAGNGGEGAPTPAPQSGKTIKSESDAKIAELTGQLDMLAKVVNMLAGTPVQKAVTGMTYYGKSEQGEEEKINLSKSEITGKLNDLTRKPELKKSDRDLINKYYEGDVDVNAIAHLLK